MLANQKASRTYYVREVWLGWSPSVNVKQIYLRLGPNSECNSVSMPEGKPNPMFMFKRKPKSSVSLDETYVPVTDINF